MSDTEDAETLTKPKKQRSEKQQAATERMRKALEEKKAAKPINDKPHYHPNKKEILKVLKEKLNAAKEPEEEEDLNDGAWDEPPPPPKPRTKLYPAPARDEDDPEYQARLKQKEEAKKQEEEAKKQEVEAAKKKPKKQPKIIEESESESSEEEVIIVKKKKKPKKKVKKIIIEESSSEEEEEEEPAPVAKEKPKPLTRETRSQQNKNAKIGVAAPKQNVNYFMD